MDITSKSVPAIVSLLARISKEQDHPLGLKVSECSSWAENLSFRGVKECKTVMYTGCLYQAIPRIETAVSLLERVDPEKIKSLTTLISKSTSLLKVLSRGREWNENLRGIHELLKVSGVEVGYQREVDIYSGVLFYDLGLEEAFKDRVLRVLKSLEDLGASKVLTVDPHTTIALKEGLKLHSARVEVNHYIELLKPDLIAEVYTPNFKRVIIHDPCHLARDLNLHGKVREFLEVLNVEWLEPKEAKLETQCCGGPLEMIDPKTSIEIGVLRVKELSSLKGEAVVAPCPICISNLRRASKKLKAKLKIVDLPQLVVKKK